METIALKSKAPPKVGNEASDERLFLDFYKVTLQALLSGESFELSDSNSGGTYRLDGEAELQMVRHLVWLADYAATVAEQMYRKKREVTAFNQKIQ